MEAFSDPMVEGVTLYLSDFTRPVADKLINGDIFSGAFSVLDIGILRTVLVHIYLRFGNHDMSRAI